MSGSISAPQGFFQNDTVAPNTTVDLESAVEAALNAASGITASVTQAQNWANQSQTSATASSGSASAAAASASAAASSDTDAQTQANTATSQASAAAASATAASGSASSASTSAGTATTQAGNAATSASAAASSATAASTSATNASSSASAASASAGQAATSATNAANSATSAQSALTNFLASPAFTGTPTAPTQTAGDTSTALATDAFVATAVTNAVAAQHTTDVATFAPLASPALTGTPTAPTQTTSDTSTAIATDAFVHNVVTAAEGTATPLPVTNAGATGVSTLFARQDHTHPDISPSGSAFKNFIDNPLLTITQQLNGNVTTLGNYLTDRWRVDGSTDTVTVSLTGVSTTDSSAMETAMHGACAAPNYIKNVFTGSSTAGAYNKIDQRKFGPAYVRSGTWTLAFLAKASSGTPKIGCTFIQNFGTGGSPSASVTTVIGTTTALTSTWTLYTFQVTIPTTAGKSYGSNGNAYCEIAWWCSDQANTSNTGIGVQSGTVELSAFQFEPAPAFSGLACRSFADEALVCSNYWIWAGFYAAGYASAASQVFTYCFNWPNAMWSTPTLNNTAVTPTATNCTAVITPEYGNTVKYTITATAAGAWSYSAEPQYYSMP